MAQHDYVIANGTGAAVRSDLNNALAAIVSNNSGSTEPATTYAYQWWADTTANQLKLRNAANSAWITIQELDGTMLMEDGSAATPGLAFASDLDTGFFRAGTNQLGIATNGTVRLTATTTAITSALPVDVLLGSASTPSYTFTGDLNTGIYSPGADQIAIATAGVDRFKVEADGDVIVDGGTVFVDATNNRVGIGTSSPGQLLDVAGTARFGGLATKLTTYSDSTYAGFFNGSSLSSDESIYMGAGGTYFYNNGSPSVTIDSSGDVGIGTTSPVSSLHISGTGSTYTRYVNTSNASQSFDVGSNSGGTSFVFENGNYPLLFGTNGSERARIDASGRLLVGTSSSSASAAAVLQGFAGSSAGQGILQLQVGKNTAATAVDENLGSLRFANSDGNIGAQIAGEADLQWNSGDYPSRLVFSTTADGASSPTERMRITNNGTIMIGSTSDNPGGANIVGTTFGSGGSYLSATRDSSFYAVFNRKTNDGDILLFAQDGTTEGTISVSGTTVSYNGAHLSRWSQLPGGAERTEILRGTVLSNIDEMCAWGEEENEQLNRMKVSDVEGDPNVSGVFQAWDDDDDTYTDDFYCAMTGDFIIRIGAGVTVERGDLLMSAGDGTAKPQDDDIIRSKTIAKVTSTNVSCTYDDGSYCVPCVLMAC